MYFRDCHHATCGPVNPAHATCGADAPDRAMHSPDIAFCTTRGICVTICVFVYATCGLGFTLRPAPWCTSEDIQPPCQVVVLPPIFMARDPCSTHSMFTRHAADVMKPVDRLQLSSAATPLTLSPVPTSIYSVLTNPHRCCAMEEEYEALLLTARETWFLGLLGPMSSQTSGSSSTSSRRMILLTGTRLVGSFEVHSAA
jgi:hypothetical protein